MLKNFRFWKNEPDITDEENEKSNKNINPY